MSQLCFWIPIYTYSSFSYYSSILDVILLKSYRKASRLICYKMIKTNLWPGFEEFFFCTYLSPKQKCQAYQKVISCHWVGKMRKIWEALKSLGLYLVEDMYRRLKTSKFQENSKLGQSCGKKIKQLLPWDQQFDPVLP